MLIDAYEDWIGSTLIYKLGITRKCYYSTCTVAFSHKGEISNGISVWRGLVGERRPLLLWQDRVAPGETGPLCDRALGPYRVSFWIHLCGWFISWSLEHTKHAGFNMWLCHFPCCSSEASCVLISLTQRGISPLCPHSQKPWPWPWTGVHPLPL